MAEQFEARLDVDANPAITELAKLQQKFEELDKSVAKRLEAIQTELLNLGKSAKQSASTTEEAVKKEITAYDKLVKSLAAVAKAKTKNVKGGVTEANAVPKSVAKQVSSGGVESLSDTQLQRTLSAIKIKEDAERSLTSTVKAEAKKRADAKKAAADAEIKAAEFVSKQEALYNQYMFDQQKGLEQKEANRIAGLARTRYALYDVSNAAAITGAALTAGLLLPAKAAIDFEKAFANVDRVTNLTAEATQQLKADLIDLSTTIPVSFEQITAIATLAGQLGIASSSIDEFTATTAKFSATTNMTVEASATALGRLAQLLPDVGTNYEALASSILKVGVNSVATESQIVAISTQIAGIASAAGLSTDEVIGLSGALASVGTAPELSRSLVTRLFTNIQVAVANGGAALEDFGAISKQSGTEFQQSWRNDAGATLLGFFEGIADRGEGATSALQALGIASVRDIPAIIRLAGASDVLKRALDDAGVGFSSGTELASQYSIIAETTSAKLEKLNNSFQAFLASIGESATQLGPLIDGVNNLLRGFTALSSSPVGQWIIGTVAALTALGAGIAIVTAVATRLTATMYALEVAELSAGAAAGLAAGAMTALNFAMKAIPAIAVVTALTSIVVAIMQANGAFDSASEKAKNFFGDLSALDQAVKLDTEQYLAGTADAFQVLTTDTKKNTDATKENSDTKRLFGVEQDGASASVDGATESIEAQTIALGKNTEAVLRKMLAENEALKALANNPQQLTSLEALGFDSEAYIQAVKQGGDALNAYLDSLEAKITGIQSRLQSGNVQTASDAIDSLRTAGDAFSVYVDGLTSASTANELFGNTTSDTIPTVEELSSQLQAQVDDIFATVNAQNKLDDSMSSLGQAFAENGARAAFSGQEMQTAIANILASANGNAPQAAGMLQSLFDQIVAGGYASAEQLIYLQRAIAGLSGGKAVTAIPINFTPFISGAKKAGAAAGGAAKKIVTLKDYASDLAKVFNRAFDIRFSGQSAIDNVTKSFNDIAQANENAREAIQGYNQDILDLQASITKLTSDKAIQEYFLSVATAYGDTIRAGEIRAELAQIDADLAEANIKLAKTNASVAKEQARLTKTTLGNSDAAIANRAELRDLVSGYQDYIEALAASGADQATLQATSSRLKQEFIDQATQLGFNQSELGDYAAAFDDVSVAIANVPRNITVNVNPNPALTALAEIESAARSAGGAIQSIAEDSAKAARGAVLMAQISEMQAQLNDFVRKFGSDWGYVTKKRATIAALSAQLNSQNYATGGYVSGPGGPTADKIPAMLSNGEYVIKASAVSYYGSGMLNALNQMQVPKRGYAAGGSVGMSPIVNITNSNATMVELSPTDRALLRNLGGSGEVTLVADNIAIARSANAGNRDIVAQGGRP